MSVGLLTGRPAEETPGSAGDLLPELPQLHEQVRQVMQGIAQALWPSVSLPKGIGELAEKLKGARQHFRLWKISACRQGARQACGARWEEDPCQFRVWPGRAGRQVFPTRL